MHTGLDRTGECLLCVQGSVSYVYRGSVSCVYRVQGECLMCTQGECFLFVCLIKGTVVVKKNFTFLKTPLPLHGRFDKRHGNATAMERQRRFRVSN